MSLRLSAPRRTALILAGSIAALLATPAARATNTIYTVTSTGTINESAATYTLAGGTSVNPVPDSTNAGDVLRYNTATPALTLNLDQAVTIGAVRNLNTGAFTIGVGGGTLTLDGTGITGSNASSGGANGVAALSMLNTGTLTVDAPIVLNTSADIQTNISGSGAITVNGTIDAATTGAATKTLTFKVPNGTGTITIAGDVGTGVGTGNIAINNTSNGGGFELISGNLGAQVVSVTNAGTNTFVPMYLTGANTAYAGTTTQTSGILFAQNTAATNVLTQLGTGGVVLNGGTLNLRANGSASNSTIITGNGTTGNDVTVGGNATLDVNRITTTAGIPGSTGTFTGSTFQFNNLTIGAQTLSVTGGNTYGLRFAGTTTATGAAIFNPTTSPLSLSALTIGDTVATGTTTTVTLGGTSGANTVTGIISNNGTDATKVLALTKRDSGTWTLTAANAYTGATTIGTAGSAASGGTVTVGTGTAGAGTGQINFSSGYTINGAGSILNLDYRSNATTAGATTNRLNDNGAVTFNLGGELVLNGNTSAATAETIGTLTLGTGSGIVSLNNGGSGSTVPALTAGAFDRGVNKATALIRGSFLGVGGTATRLIVTDPTALTSTQVGSTTNTSSTTLKIVPFLVGDTSGAGLGSNSGGGYLTYDTTSGVGLRTLLASEVTTFAAATATDNARTTISASGTTSVAGKTVNSLYTITSTNNTAATFAGDGTALTVTSGALGTGSGATTNSLTFTGYSAINLGNGEGAVYVGRADETLILASPVNVAGTTLGSGGGPSSDLTKFGLGTLTLTAANLYTGSTTINQGTLQLGTGGNFSSLAAGNTAAIAVNGGTVAFVRNDDFTLANTITGAGGFTKTGAGTATLTANNTFLGTVTANYGPLVLDAINAPSGTSTNFLLGGGNAVVLGGGTLEFRGKTGGGNTTNQTIGAVSTTVNTGLNSIFVNQNGGTATNLVTGALTRGAGSALLFDLTGTTTSSVIVGTAFGTGAINGGILIKDSAGRVDFAFNNNSTANAITALNSTTDLAANAANTSSNTRLTGSQTLTGGTPSTRSLRIDPSSNNQSLTLDPSTATSNFSVPGGGILFVGANDFTINQSGGSTGAIADGTGGSSFIVLNHFGTGKLTLDVKLAGNSAGATGSVSLLGTGLFDWVKRNHGTGTVIIGGATVRNGSTGGQLLDATATGAGSGNIVLSSGGILELTDADLTRNVGTVAGALQFLGNGGFSATGGAARNVTLASGAVQVWGAASFVPDGATLVLGSATSTRTVNLQNPINLGSVNRVVEARDGANNGAGGATVDGQLSGILSGTGGLTKTGTGRLNLSSTSNSYAGPTIVAGGTLEISGSINAASQISVANGTLLLSANNAVNSTTAPVTLGSSVNSTSGTIALDNTLGDTTQNFGNLTLRFNSTLDFGTGGNVGLLNFKDFVARTGSATLSILNWTGTPYMAGTTDDDDRLLFTGESSDFTDLFTNQADVSFNGVQGYEAISFGAGPTLGYEIVAVPEPSSTALIGVAVLLGLLGFRERRRLRVSAAS